MATLDAISHGRLTFGVAIGYREESSGCGADARNRVPKLVESLTLMKQLWSGQEVTFAGRYTRVSKLRMGLTPCKTLSTDRHGLPERACYCQGGAPHRWCVLRTTGELADISKLLDVYQQARVEAEHSTLGLLGASRALLLGQDRAEAARIGRAYLERTFANYRAWAMQESTMVPLALSFDRPLGDWTVHGSTADCVETLLRVREEMGLTDISSDHV